MCKRLLSILVLTALLTSVLSVPALAATYEEINQDSVFLKEEGVNGTCTLVSTAMMLRRAALLNGDENWSDITVASCREAFWRSGVGLSYNFSYGDMTVSHDWLPGGESNRQALIDLLEQHPEGIMLHAACIPHGVLLTEYRDGQFYCADPAISVGTGVIPIEEAWGTRIENASAYWYVSSPVAEVEEEEAASLAAPETVQVERSLQSLLTGGLLAGGEEEEKTLSGFMTWGLEL